MEYTDLRFDGRVIAPLVSPTTFVREMHAIIDDPSTRQMLADELDALGVPVIDLGLDFEPEPFLDVDSAALCVRAFSSAFPAYYALFPSAALDDNFYGHTYQHERLARAAQSATFRELVGALGPYRKDLARAVARSHSWGFSYALIFAPFIPAEWTIKNLSRISEFSTRIDTAHSDAFLHSLTRVQLRQLAASEDFFYSDCLQMLCNRPGHPMPSPLTFESLHESLRRADIVDQEWEFTLPVALEGMLDCEIGGVRPTPLLSHRSYIDVGESMENCVGDLGFAERAKSGHGAVLLWPGENPILAELQRKRTDFFGALSVVDPEWELVQIHGHKNSAVDEHVRQQVESHLTTIGAS